MEMTDRWSLQKGRFNVKCRNRQFLKKRMRERDEQKNSQREGICAYISSVAVGKTVQLEELFCDDRVPG